MRQFLIIFIFNYVNSSFINDVIVKAGGENIFGDLADAYPMVSEESIITRQPAVILIPSSSGQEPSSVGLRKGWADIPAVKNVLGF